MSFRKITSNKSGKLLQFHIALPCKESRFEAKTFFYIKRILASQGQNSDTGIF